MICDYFNFVFHTLVYVKYFDLSIFYQQITEYLFQYFTTKYYYLSI